MSFPGSKCPTVDHRERYAQLSPAGRHAPSPIHAPGNDTKQSLLREAAGREDGVRNGASSLHARPVASAKTDRASIGVTRHSCVGEVVRATVIRLRRHRGGIGDV